MNTNTDRRIARAFLFYIALFALIEMVLFIITVFVAYAYVWKRGGLEWD